MSSSALETQGLVLKKGDGASPEVFTAVPEIVDISGPDGSAPEIDATDLSSTSKEYKIGLKDNGSVTFNMHYIPANTTHAALRTAWSNRTLTNFQMLFTDSPQTQWSFAAYVQNFSMSASTDDTIKASVTLRISGDITES